MNPDQNNPATAAELEASLERLDIRELEERMEVSPLLMEVGETADVPHRPTLCCVCKIPSPGTDGFLPVEQVDPGPNTDLMPTGPTNPGIPR